MGSLPVGNYDCNDPSFVSDLYASDEAVFHVARWLHQRGNNVTIKALRVRDAVENMGDYGDVGDLEIIHRAEVKHRPKLHFTCAEDYPYSTLIVDVSHAFDRARPRPWVYYILNAAMTHCAVIMGAGHKSWSKVQMYDVAKKRTRTFYTCPVSRARFMPCTLDVIARQM